MTDPINLDRLEEELKEISPWPWEPLFGMVVFPFHPPPGYFVANIAAELLVVAPGADCDQKNIPNQSFIAKAPETIAALVKEMKSLQWKVDYYKRQLAGLGWKDNQILKRGSDEV